MGARGERVPPRRVARDLLVDDALGVRDVPRAADVGPWAVRPQRVAGVRGSRGRAGGPL